MKWPTAFRPLIVAAAVLLVSYSALLAGRAAVEWGGVGIVSHLVTAWWGLIVAASFVASVLAAFVFLGDARTWAQSTVRWRTVALNVAGLLACLAYFAAVIVAVVAWRWWPHVVG